jgi:uncharacterized protein (DUF983 family)
MNTTTEKLKKKCPNCGRPSTPMFDGYRTIDVLCDGCAHDREERATEDEAEGNYL